MCVRFQALAEFLEEEEKVILLDFSYCSRIIYI
jgi:hypothetical protein